MSTSSITSKGQVAIPDAVREKYQLQPGDKILLEEKGGILEPRSHALRVS